MWEAQRKGPNSGRLQEGIVPALTPSLPAPPTLKSSPPKAVPGGVCRQLPSPSLSIQGGVGWGGTQQDPISHVAAGVLSSFQRCRPSCLQRRQAQGPGFLMAKKCSAPKDMSKQPARKAVEITVFQHSRRHSSPATRRDLGNRMLSERSEKQKKNLSIN